MKKSKTLLACLGVLSLSSLAFGFETGGLISNDTTFKGNDELKLDQTDTATLWGRTALNDDGSSYFVVEGSFKTEYDDGIPNSDDKLKLTLDFSLVKLVLKQELDEGTLTFSAGRFFNSDLSGIVFAQNADGVKATYEAARFELSGYAAYTGLLNAKNVTILDDMPPELDSKKVYVLANKYVVGGLTFSLPHIVKSQTISLEGFGAFGLEDDSFNRFYGTLALSGPLVSPVFYELSSTLGFANPIDGYDMSNLSKISITAYPSFKSMSISLNGVYASGKQVSFEAFQGFTSSTAAECLSEPEYSGIAKAGLAATIKPIEQLLLSLSGDAVFSAEKDIEYYGFQYAAALTWQVVSDVSMGASFGQFFGKDNSDDDKTQLKITANIAF